MPRLSTSIPRVAYPPASVLTPTPPQHSAPTPSTQGTPHPKRKDSYQHTFSNSKQGRHGNHHQSNGSNPPRTNDRAPFPFTPKPRFEVFTTLNTTYENVLVHEAPIIPKPPPQRSSSKPMPNTGVFCHFHQFSGHDTESCVVLCNVIEGLIREGKLDKYVHHLPPPPPNPHQWQINMISTISGGPMMVGTSNNSIKHYVRSTYAHKALAVTQAPAPPQAGTEQPEDPKEESVTQQVRIDTSLPQELRSDLVAFLHLNSEKRRACDPERYDAMRAEVDKLSTIGFIKEVDYPTWLANVVMVRKPKKG
ncbi:unnamed protein product [Prunus brigantina]